MPGYVKLREIATVIRSKNAGPYEITFDIMFADRDTYERVKRSKVINRQLIARTYRIDEARVSSIVEFDPAQAIKITVGRLLASGDPGETDVYGAQQSAPLFDIEIPWSD